MTETALIIPVPPAEPYVGTLRDRYDPAAAEGVPAHITILYPFVPLEQLNDEALRRIELLAASCMPFDFRIGSPARFLDNLYLQPIPAQPFIDLTKRVVAEFPEFPPYGGRFTAIIPHLTVARGAEADLVEAERLLWSAHEVIDFACRCDALVLIEKSFGRWTARAKFSFAGRRP